MRGCRLAAFLTAAGLAVSGVGAQEPARPVAPGVLAADARRIVDIDDAPWNAVVRVQTNIGSRCTGTLLAPRIVLTAAHCFYNPRTRRMLSAVSVHVLVGYAKGDYRQHLTLETLHLPDAYTGPGSGLGQDWALLRLSAAAEAPFLPWAGEPPAVGERLAVAGFSQDRTHLLMADQACRLGERRTQGAAELLIHECSASRGTSGGPILARSQAGWRVVGLNVAAGPTGNIGLWHRDIAAKLARLTGG